MEEKTSFIGGDFQYDILENQDDDIEIRQIRDGDVHIIYLSKSQLGSLIRHLLPVLPSDC